MSHIFLHRLLRPLRSGLALALAGFAGLGCVAAPASAQGSVEVRTVRWKAGDDPRWAEPALDDSAWPEIRFLDVPQTEGIVVLRAEPGARAADRDLPRRARLL
jgi:hypothetical protein